MRFLYLYRVSCKTLNGVQKRIAGEVKFKAH